MERKKCERYDGARYPDLAAWLAARGRAAGVGLLVGGLALPGCFMFQTRLAGDIAPPGETGRDSGVDSGIMGDIADTQEPTDVRLPEVESRLVEFSDPWGIVRYHLEVLMSTDATADAVAAKAEEILAAVDQVLGTHPVTDFEGTPDLTALEAELVQVLAAVSGLNTARFLSLALVIDHYEDVDDIDGDMPAL